MLTVFLCADVKEFKGSLSNCRTNAGCWEGQIFHHVVAGSRLSPRRM